MKLSVPPFTLPCIVAILAFASNLSAADFLDDFSENTSANYVYTSSYGTDTATWNVSGGTLNMPVTGGGGQTANLFYKTATLAIGKTVSVEVTAPDDVRLDASTTTRGPNTSGQDGVRFNWKSDGKFKVENYDDNVKTTISFHSSFDIDGPASLTLYLTRETDNTYSAAFDSGSGITQLNTTGGTEKQIFTAGDTGNGDMFIGVETFGSGVRNFDNLQVNILAEQPIISNFSASSTTISEPGEVTFNWSATNASTVTLNGQDVTAQSSATIFVNEKQDFTLLVTSSNGTTISQVVRVVIGESFSIAAVADPQYADADPRGGREPRKSKDRLLHAVSEWNKRDLDWGVILGDIIDWDDIDYSVFPSNTNTQAPQDWENTNTILNAWNQLQAPKYLVLGNHDFYVPHQDSDGLKKPHSVYRKFGFKNQAYYAFRHKGFRFIVLEGDNSHLNYALGTPEQTEAQDYFDNVSGSTVWWNAGIKTPQLVWLLEQLDESQALNEPIIVMCHYPVHTPDGNHSLYNAAHIREILGKYPNMRLWLNGHNHSGAYKYEFNRHHLNLKGMQEGADRWYQLDFSPDRLMVFQAEDTINPVYDLDISLPSQSLNPPQGLTITEVNGDARLSWETDAADATSLVIERRHVSTAEAWQEIATLNTPTAKTHTDSPPQSVSEYKYRIRFVAGGESSPYSQALSANELTKVSYADYRASLGTGYELPFADADGDGKSNVLEQFYGTPPGLAENDAARELKTSTTPAGVKQMIFSYDTSTLTSWDVSLSKDLITWKNLSKDVDYRIALAEAWSPSGSSQSLTRVTLETMDASSFDFKTDVSKYFMRLVVSPSL